MEKIDSTQEHEQRNPVVSAFSALMDRYVAVVEIAVEQQKHAEEMEEAAMLDPLTGLRNRRALEETFESLQEGQNFRREHDKVTEPEHSSHSLLLLDVDNFKSVNDSSGHVEGDEILKKIAEIMGHRTRNRDIVSRWGGDEFAILLPRSSEENAAKIAEEIRENVENQTSVTISVGVLELDLTKTLVENYDRADVALYEAKQLGRNQVVSGIDLTS